MLSGLLDNLQPAGAASCMLNRPDLNLAAWDAERPVVTAEQPGANRSHPVGCCEHCAACSGSGTLYCHTVAL